MVYRDERDAMRERATSLEQELAEAKAHAERSDELEIALEAKQNEVDELRRKLAAENPANAHRWLRRSVGAALITALAP